MLRTGRGDGRKLEEGRRDVLFGVTAAGSPKLQSLNKGTENLVSPTASRMLGGEHAAAAVETTIETANIQNSSLSIFAVRYQHSETSSEARGEGKSRLREG